MSDVSIIDNGGANIASLRFALERLGASSRLTADPVALRAANRVILPGVGAAADAMTRLQALDLVDLIPRLTQPVLGICLGMQLLFVAPLNWTGDIKPSSWSNGEVTTTPGFREAFRQFVEAGWQGVQHPQEYGGQGLPKLVATACNEMLQAANLSFALCPLLTDGAIEALLTAGSGELRDLYVPRLIDGTWTGTMNLTEAPAGSDLALVRTRAVRQPDGTYRVSGQKIFISYGDHDLAENIVHLVLARTPDAPEGVKGMSLFVVPKRLVNADGTLGKRNESSRPGHLATRQSRVSVW